MFDILNTFSLVVDEVMESQKNIVKGFLNLRSEKLTEDNENLLSMDVKWKRLLLLQ